MEWQTNGTTRPVNSLHKRPLELLKRHLKIPFAPCVLVLPSHYPMEAWCSWLPVIISRLRPQLVPAVGRATDQEYRSLRAVHIAQPLRSLLCAIRNTLAAIEV